MFNRHVVVRDAREEYVVLVIGRSLTVMVMSLSDRRSRNPGKRLRWCLGGTRKRLPRYCVATVMRGVRLPHDSAGQPQHSPLYTTYMASIEARVVSRSFLLPSFEI